MRRLFLHVGTYKTATTTLQMLCARHREWLLERGILYPQLQLVRSTGYSINHRLLAERVLANLKSETFAELPAYWREQLAPQLSAHPTCSVLLSAEGLSRLALDPHRRRVEALQRCLEGFEVHVIFYVRRQDHWYEAMYNQFVKASNETRSLAEYVADGIAKGRADFARQLDFWSRSFGGPRMIVRVFERSQMQAGDVVRDFFGLLGIDDLSELSAVPAQNRRISPTLLELKRAINPYLKQHSQRKFAQRTLDRLQRLLPEPGGRAMPYALAREIMETHATSNDTVARRFLQREGPLFRTPLEDEAAWQYRPASPLLELLNGTR